MSGKQEKLFQTPFCEDHPDEVAQGLCKYHKKLLCISCMLEETTNSECSVAEIRKISGDQDTTLYEGLLVRQIAINRRRLIETFELKTDKLKNDLDNEVTDFLQKLVMTLNIMKTDSLNSIRKAADEVKAQHKDSKQQLETFEREITENLGNLSAESNVDLSMIQKNIQEVKTKLLEKIPDHIANPEGEFTADKRLNDLLSNSTSTLGNVSLISQGYYEPVGAPNLYRNNDEVTDSEMNMNSADQLSVYLSSDEVIYSRTTETDRIKPKTEVGAAVNNSLEKQQDEGNKKQDPKTSVEEENKKKRKSKDVKKRVGFFGLFHNYVPDTEKEEKSTKTETDNETDNEDKNYTTSPEKQSTVENLTENICDIPNFNTKGFNHPHLINKTAPIDGMRQFFMPACKFSKLTYLRAGYLGLMSKAHDTVVLTSIDGKFNTKKQIPGLSDIVACGREQVAILKLVEKNLQVIKYKVSKKKFETVGSVNVNADIPKVTGFDFDEASSRFAVSSPDTLVVFKTGKIEKKILNYTKSNGVTNDVMTAYDFNNDCLYVMDTINKTMKCFSFARADYIWKIQMNSKYPARKLCLYEDKLFITDGKAVVGVNAKNGKPVLRHETYDILGDCDGICVIDGVIVFTSSSSDFDTSAKLAYISI